MKKILLAVFLTLLLALTGCSHATETAKVMWGSSTKALEKARDKALTKAFQCDVNQCMDAIVAISRKRKIFGETPKADLNVFLQDRKRARMVIMGIAGVADTTEVGLFFVPLGKNKTRVEVASLSSTAKINGSELVFKQLSKSFAEIK